MLSTLNLKRTLAVIKPHAIRHRFSILRRIQMAGFHVLQERCVKLTVEQATTFLRDKFSDCKSVMEIENLSSGPLIVLCLARQDAVELWKRLMGPETCSIAQQSSPTSLRALYGVPDDASKNAVCGSQSDDDVRHDLQFFFPIMIQEPIYTADQIHNYLCVVIYQPLTDALYEMTKAKPDDPLLWLAKFMLEHNNNKPVIREKSPQIMQHVMKIKETEAFERKQKHDDDDEGPAKCGCYLTKPSHLTTPSSSTCCNKIH